MVTSNQGVATIPLRLAYVVLGLGLLLVLSTAVPAQRQMENLTRGIVAVKQPDNIVYVGWRLFGTDPEGLAFNVYRVTGDAAPVKVNEAPITGATNYVDRGAEMNQPLRYFVRPVLNGEELAACKPATAWADRPGLAFDLVVGPRRTYFLREAEAAGWETLEGWEMLLRQGVRQFRIWTGRDPDAEALRLEDHLGL